MFSHLNDKQFPYMVDISDKKTCMRRAVAQSLVKLNDEILEHLVKKEINSPKGPVFATAILAGIEAVKKTSSLIPLCHNIPISHCNIDITLEGKNACVVCSVVSAYATGVEIEAITGASISSITLYDMFKSINNDMLILETRLLSKEKVKIEK